MILADPSWRDYAVAFPDFQSVMGPSTHPAGIPSGFVILLQQSTTGKVSRIQRRLSAPM
jgi:hypothetical protein